MSRLVCIDTQVFLWGIEEFSSPSQEEMIDKTKRFFKYLELKGDQILFPAVAYAEALMTYPPEFHPLFHNLTERSFMLKPFDAIAASAFAKIWQNGKESHDIEKIKELGGTKKTIKFDAQIIATAITNNASCIYSNDPHIRTLANGFIKVLEIPDIAQQMLLSEAPKNQD